MEGVCKSNCLLKGPLDRLDLVFELLVLSLGIDQILIAGLLDLPLQVTELLFFLVWMVVMVMVVMVVSGFRLGWWVVVVGMSRLWFGRLRLGWLRFGRLWLGWLRLWSWFWLSWRVVVVVVGGLWLGRLWFGRLRFGWLWLHSRWVVVRCMMVVRVRLRFRRIMIIVVVRLWFVRRWRVVIVWVRIWVIVRLVMVLMVRLRLWCWMVDRGRRHIRWWRGRIVMVMAMIVITVVEAVFPLFPSVFKLRVDAGQDARTWFDHFRGEGELLAVKDKSIPVLLKLRLDTSDGVEEGVDFAVLVVDVIGDPTGFPSVIIVSVNCALKIFVVLFDAVEQVGDVHLHVDEHLSQSLECNHQLCLRLQPVLIVLLVPVLLPLVVEVDCLMVVWVRDVSFLVRIV